MIYVLHIIDLTYTITNKMLTSIKRILDFVAHSSIYLPAITNLAMNKVCDYMREQVLSRKILDMRSHFCRHFLQIQPY